ncbi:MAG: glycosyltransferase family 2 protein [Desulfurivibrionaceae bacterium]|jgi:hypothetical protein
MITAIIVNYHSHLLTARAVASVLADQADAQVVVVDNSESATEVQALRSVLPAQVECIVTPENIGFGQACNLGYSKARYDWILLLNPDAFVLDGCIAALVDFLKKNPRAGAVSPRIYWDGELSWLAPPLLMHTPFTELGLAVLLRLPWLANMVSRRFCRWAVQCITSKQAVEQRMLSGGHMLLRRSAITAAGGLFDPNFFMYFEDTDLCRRLRQSSYRLFLLPAARAVHEWATTQDKADISVASHRYYFNKHFPRSRFLGWRTRLEQSRTPVRLPESHDLGLCQSPPVFSVPAGLQSGWLMEVSPHPLFIPALYCFGQGCEARIPETLWQRLGPGRYGARIGACRGGEYHCFSWEIRQNEGS